MSSEVAPPMAMVEPRPTDALFPSPGMGWQTFHRFADDPALEGLPPACCYFRWYWRDLEPAPGELATDLIDGTLARARQSGQQLAFRVMTVGTDTAYDHSPLWLREQGCPGWEFSHGTDRRHWTPDHDAPAFLDAHLRLLDELGRRYDGHPDLALVDIGSVGLWGEWHMSRATIVPGGAPAPMPSWATRRRIIDAYRAGFRRTPLVMQIDDVDGLAYAARQGIGWRADCLGDLGGFNKTWNHMQHAYPQAIAASGAGEAWRQGPVTWESCWDMRRWAQEGWPVRDIFDYALDLHGSWHNNKSAPLPAGERYREEVERFLRRAGYRLVLRRLRYPSRLRAGQALTVRMEWSNAGVAPRYGEEVAAFRLLPEHGGADDAVGRTLATEIRVRDWLPGEHTVEAIVSTPADLPAGVHVLAVGLVREDARPWVPLAIEGRDTDRWYRLGRLTVY